MKFLISGATGLIGGSLAVYLDAKGYKVAALTRRSLGEKPHLVWNPGIGDLDGKALDGYDVIIHLAGENIGVGRWTKRRRERFRSSRVNATQLLADRLSSLRRPPHTFICASAVGYYGDRGEEQLTEDSLAGQGFLADLVKEWEAAAMAARGMRVVTMRMGVVLTPRGGMLQRMLPLFRAGLGGKLGDGRQYLSWVVLEDVHRAVEHIVLTPELSGPVNVVSPTPVTMAEFTTALGNVLHRPTYFTVPALALRLALGNRKAQDMILNSARVRPQRLLASGFRFTHGLIGVALQDILQPIVREDREKE